MTALRYSALAMLAAGLLFLTAWNLHAHEWYPAICCNDRDCYEIPADAVEVVDGGYRLKSNGQIIPWDQVRETPGEAGHSFHVCTERGDPSKRIMGLNRNRACFWAPQGGM